MTRTAEYSYVIKALSPQGHDMWFAIGRGPKMLPDDVLSQLAEEHDLAGWRILNISEKTGWVDDDQDS